MSNSRNVVILGQVGSGKRTLGNHIVGSDIFQRETSVRKNVGVYYGEGRRGDTFYRILTVDTESLQTGNYINPMPYISNFQEVHLILFTIPHDRYTNKSLEPLTHTVESLPQQAKSISALVITHCEGLTDARRGLIDVHGKGVVDIMQHGAHAVGFPDDVELSIPQDKIRRDEEAIRKLVKQCEVPLNVNSLSGFDIQQPQQQRTVTEPADPDRSLIDWGLSRSNLPPEVTGPTLKTSVNLGHGGSQPKTPGQGSPRGSPRPCRPKTPERPTGYRRRPRASATITTVTSVDLQPTLSSLETPVNVSQPKTSVHVGLLVDNLDSELKAPGQRDRRQLGYGPSDTTGFQRHPKTPLNVSQGASLPMTPGEGSVLPKTPKRQLESQLIQSQVVRKRCVVLMGKSGAGKSTVANQLVGHDPLSPYDPPFRVSTQVLQSVTREVKDETVEFKQESILYRVTVIDTVGLFDTSIEGQDPIFDKIEAYFKDYNIEGINLILFVFKKGRFTAEEKEVFSYIRSKFDAEISPISALAVTGCENDTPIIRAGLVKEFQDSEASKLIADH